MEEKKIKTELLDKDAINRAITRIGHEIIEKNKGASNIIIIGIRSRGDILAKRIAQKIAEIEKIKVPIGALDITLYRDDYDLNSKIQIKATEIPFAIDDKDIVLVDDVLFTGRTIRAAMDALIDFGRPRSIQLAVLIDRGHRQLPIQANYVGKNVPTSLSEGIVVQMSEKEADDKVMLSENNSQRRN
ncbi:MAG: bifunctional pyr operon transcriptional regulator/uracil phosphoribosyltransferase PyrR [bacterium]